VRAAIATAGLLLALQSQAAFACGHCIEDRIAAVYDHALVSRALGQQHQVVFYAIDGPLPPGDASRRAIEALADSADGVDKGSARVSIETASLAVAFDPRRVPYAAVERNLGRKFAARKLSLSPLRAMDKPAELNAIGRK